LSAHNTFWFRLKGGKCRFAVAYRKAVVVNYSVVAGYYTVAVVYYGVAIAYHTAVVAYYGVAVVYYTAVVAYYIVTVTYHMAVVAYYNPTKAVKTPHRNQRIGAKFIPRVRCH
jgi:hypothetical protein